MLSAAVSAGTEISADCIPRGPDEPDCHTDAAFAAPELVKPAIQAEREGFDAIAIYCLNDVGLEALREKVQIPVIAPGQALYRLFDGKAGGGVFGCLRMSGRPRCPRRCLWASTA